jgi:Zn-dependent peptidase ImmA (M78 family)
LDAVVAINNDGSPTFVIPVRKEENQRFLFCRGLSEFLRGSELALLVKSASDPQQRNRAFAAEFLAPASGLRQRVSGAQLDPEEVEALARDFGVSSLVIKHQLENHRIAEIAGP